MFLFCSRLLEIKSDYIPQQQSTTTQEISTQFPTRASRPSAVSNSITNRRPQQVSFLLLIAWYNWEDAKNTYQYPSSYLKSPANKVTEKLPKSNRKVTESYRKVTESPPTVPTCRTRIPTTKRPRFGNCQSDIFLSKPLCWLGCVRRRLPRTPS